MFDSKSPVVKFVGYSIIGFFSIIIIISFGMPDFMSKIGLDKSIVAIINGKKIHRFDFLDYKKRFMDRLVSMYGMELANMYKDDMIISQFIREQLLIQKLKDMGFTPTDERIAEYIHKTYADKQTKKLDVDSFKRLLERHNTNITAFQTMLKEEFSKQDFQQTLKIGMPFSIDDINIEYISQNSESKIKYAFISNRDLEKRFKNNITVSDKEIADELLKNKHTIKDVKTDKFQAKKKIENRRLSQLKEQLVNSINDIAKKNGSFEQANALLAGTVSLSNTFKIGEPIKEDKKNGKSLRAINDSKIFLNDFFNINPNVTSKVIEDVTGYYIFTPIIKNIKNGTPDTKEHDKLVKTLKNQGTESLSENMMKKWVEGSKIIKNYKN